jgi:hypothetical protein
MKKYIYFFINVYALCTLFTINSVQAQMNLALTYQGRLEVNQGPANGTYDLTFQVVTNSAGGLPLTEAVTNTGVVIGEANPDKLELSSQAYDRKVAGVVSGAGGITPGLSLIQENALEPGQNVALTGRVYVLTDATFGAVQPGDLLTTSDTPGYAMKASDQLQAQGAILGKAMTALNDGKGLVLVLVTLQ